MNVQITNINIRYQEGQVSGAQVYFNGSNGDRSINLNGYIPISPDELNLNVEEIQLLVKNKIIDRLQENASPSD